MALARRMSRPDLVRKLGDQVRPVSASGTRILPVLPALESLLPDRGLRRGSVVAVSGSTSLALALLVSASQTGSWCAAVGAPSLGLLAAAELGISLERFPLVAAPRSRGPGGWAWVVAALLDTVDVVLAWPPTHLGAGDHRRLVARARERGSVLLMSGAERWPSSQVPLEPDVALTMVGAQWEGIGHGHGRLSARRLDVVAEGRHGARRQRLSVWLPGPDGSVAPTPGSATGTAPDIRPVANPAIPACAHV